GEGLRFDRCYTTFPICLPNRATMLTSRTPGVHGLIAGGCELQVDLQASFIPVEPGQIVHLLVRDAGEQHRLQRERQYLATIIEEAVDLAVIRDMDLRVIAANHAFLRAIGAKDIQEVVGKTDRELLEGCVDAEVIEARIVEERQVQTLFPDELIVGEEVWTTVDGVKRTLLFRKFPVFDDGGRLIATACIASDITERKQAEQQLQRSEERVRMILEHSHDGINIKRADPETGRYRLVLMNNRFVEMTGRSREELLACENLDRLMTVEDPAGTWQRWLDLLREGKPFTGRGSWKRPDGRENWFDWSAARVMIDGEVHVVGMDRDVTEHVLAERQRRELEAQVQHAQKLESLGVLAGGIAHDFNNLLVAMLGNADLALMELDESSSARLGIEEVKKAALRASDLTNQMLAYSGRGSFAIRPLDLNDLVRQMAHLLEVSISKKTVLRFDLDPALCRFQADASQIQQVVMNLITNAADAIGTERGTITLRTEVRQVGRAELAGSYVDDDLQAGRYVCLEVEDTGCGMTAEQQRRVFEPFFTTKFTGRGLGLAAVLGIVRGHGGAIQIDSTLDRGTTFRILLPAHEEVADPARASIEAEAATPESNWQATGTVLLVDDQVAVRTVAKAMLKRLGFDVVEAEDGSVAVEAYRRQSEQIDVVLLDMTMPNMAGPETLRQLLQIDPAVRVVLCSGYSEHEAATHPELSGARAFLHKPFRYDHLASSLRKAID
ncbi:MAG: response regulator, partial [Phycisphaerae bacterium]|nr:response regulator [Phycisphaerae bacterium]